MAFQSYENFLMEVIFNVKEKGLIEQENMSKNNYSRLAAIGEKVIPDLPDSQEKRYIQKTYEKYRKLSCTKP